MDWKEHCQKSKESFGAEGAEYHKWLDQYARGPEDHDHRRILHHEEGVEIGVMIFGEVARKHLIQHIEDDLGIDYVPTIEMWREGLLDVL